MSKLRVARIDWSVEIGESMTDRIQLPFPFPGDDVQFYVQVQVNFADE
jgi:hypothetical protein